MRSGGGKSMCYMLPPFVSENSFGITVCISPLVSLMEDQVMQLNKIEAGSALRIVGEAKKGQSKEKTSASCMNAKQAKAFLLDLLRKSKEHDAQSPGIKEPFKMLFLTPEMLLKVLLVHPDFSSHSLSPPLPPCRHRCRRVCLILVLVFSVVTLEKGRRVEQHP
jgi:superfamily II DNA helicase RecQ